MDGTEAEAVEVKASFDEYLKWVLGNAEPVLLKPQIQIDGGALITFCEYGYRVPANEELGIPERPFTKTGEHIISIITVA
jgi:hypothetical protein